MEGDLAVGRACGPRRVFLAQGGELRPQLPADGGRPRSQVAELTSVDTSSTLEPGLGDRLELLAFELGVRQRTGAPLKFLEQRVGRPTVPPPTTELDFGGVSIGS